MDNAGLVRSIIFQYSFYIIHEPEWVYYREK